MVKVYGIDFTSAPSRRKPITVAQGVLCEGALAIQLVSPIASQAGFSDLLSCEGPWIAGLDFPFGQPRKYVVNIGWPAAWVDYVRHVGNMPKATFVSEMRAYQRGRPSGDIRHFRKVDRVAGACSPMQLDFIPVARMFYAGAPALLNCGCSVFPFFSTDHDHKVAIEAYPSLVARFCVQNSSYKNDDQKKQTSEQQSARQRIVKALNASTELSSPIRQTYGTAVRLDKEQERAMVEDGTGDTLDAVLCALQAAWAYSRQEADFGMNWKCDPIEGWIADPQCQPS
jgi:uncharacterized protein DUF429